MRKSQERVVDKWSKKERRMLPRKRFFFSGIIDDVEQLYARAVV